MNNMKRVKAIIFDLSGTLIDFGCKNQINLISKAFNNKGISLNQNELFNNFGLTREEYILRILKQDRIVKEVKEKLGQDVNNELIEKFQYDMESLMLDFYSKDITIIPKITQIIQHLKENFDLKIGSTTSFSKKILDKFLDVMLKHEQFKFDYSISSSEVKKGRPYPYMINRTIEHFEIERPEYVVKVGDTCRDIEAAQNANCWSVGVVDSSILMGYSFDEFQKLNKSTIELNRARITDYFNNIGSDFVINDMKQLPKVIERINQKLQGDYFPDNKMKFPQKKYTLFTPGPLTTSKRVKMPLLIDHGSRETEYMETVQSVRKELVKLALNDTYKLGSDQKVNSTLCDKYSTIIVQGSGTFGVEAAVSSVVPKDGKLLVIINGAYGKRMHQIAKTHKINCMVLTYPEDEVPKLDELENTLIQEVGITHVGVIHSETTTGILNPIKEIAAIVKKHNKVLIVDAMSSFGAIPMDVNTMGIDYLVSSSNKNIQGVPGFSYVIANKEDLLKLKDASNYPRKSVSLDLFDQWDFHEKSNGGFRFTSPVHTIMSFKEAILELIDEGGIEKRFERYTNMQKRLVEGMSELGFKVFDLKGFQGPIITTFYRPKCEKYDFNRFYEALKERKCVIYPGKLTKEDSFRIGTIGNIHNSDIEFLLKSIKDIIFWNNKI